MKFSILIKQVLLLFFLFINLSVCAQMVGSETTISPQIYQGSFIVNGDMNTYYPVIFRQGGQDIITQLKINRAYWDNGPNELSSTHKGGLSLEIDVNYGGWGGSTYDWRIMDLRQTYHETFAGASIYMHRMGFVVWLRGGGFKYNYQSTKPANIQVGYSTSELVYDNINNGYDVYAPSAKTQIDWDNINAHKNEHWAYIKDKPFDNRGYLGINKTSPEFPIDVDGTIRATEIKVEAQTADFVFEPDYALRSLKEVETFIEENKHLPEIPSAKQMEADGVNVAEMNKLLLQKVEELTLYMIEMQKIIKKQNARINNLEN